VTVKVRFNDFRTFIRAKSFGEFSDSESEIRIAAFDCLNRFELKKKVRLIGFRISNLSKRPDGLVNHFVQRRFYFR
jgi:DNA polymerase-4